MKHTCTRTLMSLCTAALIAFAGFTPADAFEAKLTGQVNQLFMWADDGDRDDVFVADNANSSTRFRFNASKAFGKVTAGVHLEFDAQRNSSSALKMDQNNDGSFNWNDRWLNVFFDTEIGKFEIGKGSGAADSTAEMDLSGTSVINYSSVADTAGGFIWKASNGDDFFNAVPVKDKPNRSLTVSDVRNNMDGISRNERVRYNTPKFGGFSMATSFTNGEAWEVAGFYAADFAGNKVAAAVGYVDTNNRDNFKQLSGSISWLMPFGLNITGAYGLKDFDAAGRTDAENYYFKLGYKFDIHAMSVEYGWTEDLASPAFNVDKASNWGLAYVVTPWKGVELYTSYRQYMLDAATGSDPDDIRQVMVGSRIRF